MSTNCVISQETGDTIKGFVISQNTYDELIDSLLVPYFQYGRQPLYPALNSIIENIQTICEIYSNYPNTCINLLSQVMMSFTKEEYGQNVLAAIEKHEKQQPRLLYVKESLRCLRKFMGDDPSFLTDAFHREIAILPVQGNKSEIFKELMNVLCRGAISTTIENIQSLANKPKISLVS